MIAKSCPKCDQQVPVACKACPCGHSFYNAKRAASALSTSDDSGRRPQRLKRGKPNYYDSLEYDRQTRRSRLRSSEGDDEDYTVKKETVKVKKKKVKKEEEEDEDMFSNLPPEKQAQCAMILEELNRKLQLVTWRPT